VHFLGTGFFGDIVASGLTPTCKIYALEEPVLRRRGANLYCPRDGRLGTSYIDTVRGKDYVGCGTFMLSYTWSYSAVDISETLTDWARDRDLEQCRTYVWMCCMCVNQHRVREAVETGNVVDFDEWCQVFGEHVRGVGEVLALMSPWYAPEYVTRVWCVFEFSVAIREEKKLTILIPDRERVDFRESLRHDGFHRIFGTLAGLRIQDAKASVASDRENIMKFIREDRTINNNNNNNNNNRLCNHNDFEGTELSEVAFETLNSNVRHKMQTWFTDAAVGHVERRIRMTGTRGLDLRMLCHLGCLLIDSASDFPRARSLLEKAVKEHPHQGPPRALAVFHLGRTYHYQSRFQEALAFFEQSRDAFIALDMRVTSEFADVIRSMGAAHARVGDKAEASRLYELAKQTYEQTGEKAGIGYSQVLTSMGFEAKSRGDIEAALEYFMGAKMGYENDGLSLHPGYAGLLKNLGTLYFSQGQYDEALASYNQSWTAYNMIGASHDPGCTGLLECIGSLFFQCGDNDNATKFWDHAKTNEERQLNSALLSAEMTKAQLKLRRGLLLSPKSLAESRELFRHRRSTVSLEVEDEKV